MPDTYRNGSGVLDADNTPRRHRRLKRRLRFMASELHNMVMKDHDVLTLRQIRTIALAEIDILQLHDTFP